MSQNLSYKVQVVLGVIMIWIFCSNHYAILFQLTNISNSNDDMLIHLTVTHVLR